NNANWQTLSDDPPIDPFDESQSEGEYYRNDAAHGGQYIRSKIQRTLKKVEGTLGYDFTITNPGVYRFVVRGNMMPDDGEDYSETNDIWMRLRRDGFGFLPAENGVPPTWINPENEEEQWYKAFTVNWERRQGNQQFTHIWHYESNAEHTNDPAIDFAIPATGQYRLQIAPRSRRFAVDRLVLYRLEESPGFPETPSYSLVNALGFVPSKAKQHQLDQLGYTEKEATITGELKQWHRTTLDLVGPNASETETPNPFLDLRMTVTFIHPDTDTKITVPGFFAADGDAANTSAVSGNIWRAHFLPTEIGRWTYHVDFREGAGIAIQSGDVGTELAAYDGAVGTFFITESDKSGDDFRSPEKGKLLYTGKHYPEWSGGGGAFLKAEANVPEVFLAYGEFDSSGGFAPRSYASHIDDWNEGDPTWVGNDSPRGKGIIGAINYLTSLGVNCQYFLTMNVEGDGKQTHPWPYNWKDLNSSETGSNPLTFPDDLKVYDVSKLAQWQIVFDHMMSKGLKAQFVLTEQENQSFFEHYANLDAPDVASKTTFADSRKLYYRELAARFGYLNAITWNIGEENGWDDNTVYGQSNDTQDRLDFATYLDELLPYQDQIVVHNPIASPGDDIFTGISGLAPFSGVSLQGYFDQTSWGHDKVLYWRNNSVSANRPWIISYDEPYTSAVYPDIDTWRKDSVWAAFTAGAAGVGFYNDEDSKFRGEDGYERFVEYYETMVRAKDFLGSYLADITLMNPDDSLVDPGNYCFANPGIEYVVYLPTGGSAQLDLTGTNETFDIFWFDPRNGVGLQPGSVDSVTGGSLVNLGSPPSNSTDDWAIFVTSLNKNQPAFTSDPLVSPAAFQDILYSGTIQGSAIDTDGDILAYSKLSGPAWLSIAEDGSLSGIPQSGDLGINTFTVSATDRFLNTSTASLEIVVGSDEATPVVHYDADDWSSIARSNSAITTWSDKSIEPLGNTIDSVGMLQNSTSAMDSGALGVRWNLLDAEIILDGTQMDNLFNFQNGSGGDGFAIMCAIEFNDPVEFTSIISAQSGNQTPNIRIYLDSNRQIAMRINDTSERFLATMDTPVVSGETVVFGVTYEASTGSLYYWDSQGSEGTATLSINGDFSNLTPMRLGGSTNESGQGFDGIFGEIQIFDQALSSLDFQNFRDVMVAKWINTRPPEDLFRYEYGLNPDGSDDLADFSNNGLSNIKYFLFGLGDPSSTVLAQTVPGDTPLPGIPVSSVFPNGDLVYSYTNHRSQTSFQYQVDTSSDLTNWLDISNSLNPYRPDTTTVDTLNSEYEIINLHFIDPPESLFISLGVDATQN
ncbi:MAG: DUF5060 domain-containing protein, partial [Verrucomicrobiota bacterium]